ncbi:MAG: serine/threonine-protein kinase [Myxococcota bacterium]
MGTSSQPYFTLARLASGGMGTVSLVARADAEFRRIFAMKRLKAGFDDNAELRRMFLQEAQIAGQLHNAHVVPVIDIGEDASGPYMVMEYIHGLPVSAVIREAARRNKSIPVSVCLGIVRQAALGLHAAHELRDAKGRALRLIHRDVSPHNLLLGFDGVVRLTDFGVARVWGSLSKTDPGILKGKLGYMSPEQLRFNDLDQRSDLYSLGVVLFELLSGRRPYQEPTPEKTVRAILAGLPPDVLESRRDVPPTVVELLFRLLGHRDQRPVTAAEVAETIGNAMADMGASDPSAGCRAYVELELSHAKEAATAKLQQYLSDLDTRLKRRRPKTLWRVALVAAILSTVGLLGVGVGKLLAPSPLITPEDPPSVSVASPPSAPLPSSVTRADTLSPTMRPPAQDTNPSTPNRVGLASSDVRATAMAARRPSKGNPPRATGRHRPARANRAAPPLADMQRSTMLREVDRPFAWSGTSD